MVDVLAFMSFVILDRFVPIPGVLAGVWTVSCFVHCVNLSQAELQFGTNAYQVVF